MGYIVFNAEAHFLFAEECDVSPETAFGHRIRTVTKTAHVHIPLPGPPTATQEEVMLMGCSCKLVIFSLDLSHFGTGL